jgi:hypothetical protein
MSSGGAQTDVQRESLLSQARVWDEQSQAMGAMSQAINHTVINVSFAWVFASAVSAYNQVCKETGTWCDQGSQQMLQIVGALCTAATRYGATEEQLIQASDGAFH